MDKYLNYRNCIIHWIEIHPASALSIICLLNNWGLGDHLQYNLAVIYCSNNHSLIPIFRQIKLCYISTYKINVVKLCSIVFPVFVNKWLHKIYSSDMMGFLCNISSKTSVWQKKRNTCTTIILNQKLQSMQTSCQILEKASTLWSDDLFPGV